MTNEPRIILDAKAWQEGFAGGRRGFGEYYTVQGYSLRGGLGAGVYDRREWYAKEKP